MRNCLTSIRIIYKLIKVEKFYKSKTEILVKIIMAIKVYLLFKIEIKKKRTIINIKFNR